MSLDSISFKDNKAQTDCDFSIAWDITPANAKAHSLATVAQATDSAAKDTVRLAPTGTDGQTVPISPEDQAKQKEEFRIKNVETRTKLGDDLIDEIDDQWRKEARELEAEKPKYKQDHAHIWDKFLRDMNVVHYVTSADMLREPPTLRRKTGGIIHRYENVRNDEYKSPQERGRYIDDLHQDILKIQGTLANSTANKYPMILDAKNKDVAQMMSILPDLSHSLDELSKLTEKADTLPQKVHLGITAFCSDDNYNDLKDYFANSYSFIKESAPAPDRDTADNESQLAKRIELETPPEKPRKK